jgi:hypothetical protein
MTPGRKKRSKKLPFPLHRTRASRRHRAGVLGFVPLRARLHFDQIVTRAGYPGSMRVPAPSALLALGTLKLLDKERRRPINDVNCDEARGRFAGRNILPKKSDAIDSSSQTTHANPRVEDLSSW